MSAQRQADLCRLNVARGGWLQVQWSHTEPVSEVGVVYVHGFRSVRYGEKAQALELSCARRKWTFATFDFRGHGDSSGTMRELSPTQLLEDLAAVHDFLVQQGVTRLCLVGSSMGGWASAWFSLGHPQTVRAIALIAPGFHFLTARWEKLTPAERENWRREGFLRIRNDWVDTDLGYGLVDEAPRFPQEQLIQQLATPTLIFHGMRDDVVPWTRSLAFVEKAPFVDVELRLYKDGDHRLTDRKEELAEASCEFLARRLALE